MVAYHVRGLPRVKGNSKRNSSGIGLTRGTEVILLSFLEKGDEFMVERNVPERAKLDEIVELGDNDDMLYFHLNTSTDQITIGLSSILAGFLHPKQNNTAMGQETRDC